MKRGGFTLLELLVVIVILGIISTLAIPQFMQIVRRARRSEALNTMAQIRSAEMRHGVDNNGAWTADFTKFDGTLPTTTASWTYTVDITTKIITATRIGTAGCLITVDGAGAITASGINDNGSIPAGGAC